jgi:8-oxo-dGTP diphosphatase
MWCYNFAMQKITVCAFIYNNEQQLFVTKRAETKKILPGYFELPGGHVEFGEELEKALKREIREEFGLEITVGELVYAFTRVSNDGATHTVELIYLAQFTETNPIIQLNPADHSEYAWISHNELDNYFEPDDNEKVAALAGFKQLAIF